MAETEPSDQQAEVAETEPMTARSDGLSQKTGIIVVSRGLTIAVQMASIMILTRVLSKENFGIISFLLLAYSTVITLAQLGLPESVFYFFERVSEEAKKSLALLTARILFFIGIGASIIFVALNFLAPYWGFAVNGLFFPLILTALLELPSLPLPNILIAIDKAKQAAWLNICVSLLQFTALVLPALLNQPLATIVYALAGYGVLRFTISTFVFLRNFREPAGALPGNMIREQLRYSLPLALSQILWGLNKQIDKYIVAAFLPVAVYAEYVIGSWEIPFLPVIAYSVASVMMPQFVAYHLKNQKSNLLQLWNKSIHKVSIILLPLVLLFVLIAEEFITIFFTEEYRAAALPFRIYTLIILHRVAAYSSMLKAVGETKTITYSAIYLVVINSVLSIPFVIWLGMAGPPLATLIANLVTWVYVLFKIKTCLDVSLHQIFPFEFYLRTLTVSVASLLPALFIKLRFDFPAHSKLIVILIVYLITYALIASLSNVIKREDWIYFARALKIK